MFEILYFVACFSLVIVPNEGAKILGVYPAPSISHQVVFRALTLELVKRGHEVTVITTDPAFPNGGGPANLTEIDLHDLSYDIWTKEFISMEKGGQTDVLQDFEILFKLIPTVFDYQLKSKPMQDFLRDESKHFDLVIAESCMRASVVFAHLYKAPLIIFSSFGSFLDNNQVIGAPIHPFLYPTSISRKINNLSMWDKLRELYIFVMLEKMHRKSYDFENSVLKKHFGPDTPTIREINNNVSMLFVNMHPIFEGNYPVPPAVVYTGGLHVKPHKELPKDLKAYLDSSKNGVIYISFGTNVDPSMLPPEKIQTMIRVLSKLPYNVLWKWNKDELPGRSENIKISKWLPQSDLLKHPKIKLFVTQGGLQSTDEAITAGVPLIGIPMLGDQWWNIEKYEALKIGKRLDLETLTEENFHDAIITIVKDETYRRNTERLYKLITDQPMSAIDRTVWWTEYVIRHGGATHLRAPAANMSYSEYLELDLILTLLGGLLAVLIVFILILRSLYCYVCKNFCKSKTAPVKSKRS